MTLSAGDGLALHEIRAPLGAGGMGEVYRARDTKLERQVAIKILPNAVAGDPERLAPFEREAKVPAALNHHPNIATIRPAGAESTQMRAERPVPHPPPKSSRQLPHR